MNKIYLKSIVFLLLTQSFNSCNSSKLIVSVDIYGEEIYSRPSITDLENVGEKIERAEKSVIRTVNQKKELANLFVEYYVQLHSDPCDSIGNLTGLSGVFTAKDRYYTLLDKLQDSIFSVSKKVKASYADYLETIVRNETETFSNINSSNKKYTALNTNIFILSDEIMRFQIESGRSDFESTFYNGIWEASQFDQLLNNDSTTCPNYDSYISNLERVSKKLVRTYAQYNDDDDINAIEVAAIFSNWRSQRNRNSFTAALRQISNSFNNLDEYNLPIQAEDALVDLLQSSSLIYSQIYRLKDDADPIWRSITDKEAKNKWNKFYNKTKFKAQGNSSVVVVRDGPGDFRVQNGSNDPRALIQGQLEITRSLVETAISVGLGFQGIESPIDSTDSILNKASDTTRKSQIAELSLNHHKANLKLLANNLRAYRTKLLRMTSEQDEDGGQSDESKQVFKNMNNTLTNYLKSDKTTEDGI